MGSSLMFKVRICLKPLKPFLHQRSSALLTTKTSLCKPPLLPPTARFLCTRDNNRNSGHAGGRNRTFRDGKRNFGEDALDRRDSGFTLRERPSFPRSIFSAGTAKRTTEMLRNKEARAGRNKEEEPERSTTRRAGNLQPPDRPLSVAEWRKLKESLGNPQGFEDKMMRSLISSEEGLSIAKSLLTFAVMDTGTLCYKLLLLYLKLCEIGGHHAEVFDIYDIMRGSFSTLETAATSLFIKCFSRTPRWREAIGILHELKKVWMPSPRNYCDIIVAAASHGDLSTAWALYDELMEKGLRPYQETWESLFRGVGKTEVVEGVEAEAMSQSEHQERLLGILQHMRQNQIYPQHSLASSIKAWFESLTGQIWTGNWTSATQGGVCRCCRSELESIHLTAEEYQQLKDRVMTDIIQGQDVFYNTTPEELKRFKAFVTSKPAFDVVIDGLNVANLTTDRRRLSAALLAVVSELQSQGLIVLVLGRKHMLQPSRSWARHDMALIKKKAHCFFLDNITEDDPFLLYAALHSGNHCLFVSRDMMRDHKACLPDGATQRLFFKWQRGHQLVVKGHVVEGRAVKFQSIFSHDTIVQTSGDSWHIPYDDTEDRSSHEIPQRWLCLTQKP